MSHHLTYRTGHHSTSGVQELFTPDMSMPEPRDCYSLLGSNLVSERGASGGVGRSSDRS